MVSNSSAQTRDVSQGPVRLGSGEADEAENLIVTSDHLASGEGGRLSEFEFGINLAFNAFTRWIVHCMRAAGQPKLGAIDIQLLHLVKHRSRRKQVNELCLMLHIDDAHIVTYSLRKLQKLGLIESHRNGSERLYETTDEGRELCMEYRRIRERALVAGLGSLNEQDLELREMAKRLRAVSGFYDQAARAAATL